MQKSGGYISVFWGLQCLNLRRWNIFSSQPMISFVGALKPIRFIKTFPPQNYHLQPICDWFYLLFYWAKLFVGLWSFGPLGLPTQNFNEGRGCSSWYTDGHGSRLGPSGKVILPNERSDSLPPKCLGWFWNEQIGFCQPRIISEMIWGVRFLSQIFFQQILLLWGCSSR